MIYISVLSAAAFAAIIFAFYQGYKLGYHNRPEPVIKKPRVESRVYEYEESDEERKFRIEMENIDNYGTNRPQREVK